MPSFERYGPTSAHLHPPRRDHPYFSPIFLVGAESLVSGRRVKGREAIACDAGGALDAVAATGTLVRQGIWHTPARVSVQSICLPDHRVLRVMPGAPPGSAPRAAARCERGRARRSRLDLRTAQLGNAELPRAGAVTRCLEVRFRQGRTCPSPGRRVAWTRHGRGHRDAALGLLVPQPK